MGLPEAFSGLASFRFHGALIHPARGIPFDSPRFQIYRILKTTFSGEDFVPK